MTTAQNVSLKDLPYWMSQARRGVDWGVLLAVAFSLALAWPFILQPGLPHTTASENYVFRTADDAQAIMEGRLYPRWSPHVFGGYGAPIPNYYPPGPAYSAALIQVLITDDPVTAVRIVYIVALCLCGSMTYVFVTRRAGSAAGLLAAVLYVASPYAGLTAPHLLGDLPGVIGLALVPTLLWAIDRLLILNRPHDVVLVAFTVAALLLTSPRDAIPGLVLAALLVGWHVVLQDRRSPWNLVVASALLGVGLAAFFWLPAVMEHDLVRWRPPVRPSMLRLTLESLFLPMRQIDLAEMIPRPQLTLGLVCAGAALLGLLGATRRRAAFHLLFLFAGALLTVLALTVAPGEFWLLGSISLCAAIAGSGLLHLHRDLPARFQRLFLPGVLVAALIGSLPVWLAPHWAEAFGSTEPQAQIQLEQQSREIAVLPPDLPIPTTIAASLAPNRSLIEGYLSGDVNKIAFGQLGGEVRVGVLEHRTHSDRFQLQLGDPIVLNILTAYFPGWQATLAERPVPLTANPQTGLIQLDMPIALNEELLITFGPTPIRTEAWAVTWLILALTLALMISRVRRGTGVHDDLEFLTTPEARLAGVVLGCFVAIILLFALPSSPLTLRVRPGSTLDNSYSLRSHTDVGLEAIAYRLDRFEYRPGDTLDLTLYWQTLRPLTQDFQIQLYLLNTEGVHWLPSAFQRPGDYSTRRWIPNRFTQDEHRLPLSLTIVPGSYRIAVEVYDCNVACSNPVSFFDAEGRLVGSTLILPTPITIIP